MIFFKLLKPKECMCLFAVIGERGMLAHFLFHDALVKKRLLKHLLLNILQF